MNNTKVNDTGTSDRVVIGASVSVAVVLLVTISVVILVVLYKRKLAVPMSPKSEIQREDSVYSAVMFSGGKGQPTEMVRSISYASIHNATNNVYQKKELHTGETDEADHQYFVLEKSAGISQKETNQTDESGRNKTSVDSGYFTLQCLTTSDMNGESDVYKNNKGYMNVKDSNDLQNTKNGNNQYPESISEYSNMSDGYYVNQPNMHPKIDMDNVTLETNCRDDACYNGIYVNEGFQGKESTYENCKETNLEDEEVFTHLYDHTRDILQENNDLYDHIVRN